MNIFGSFTRGGEGRGGRGEGGVGLLGAANGALARVLVALRARVLAADPHAIRVARARLVLLPRALKRRRRRFRRVADLPLLRLRMV